LDTPVILLADENYELTLVLLEMTLNSIKVLFVIMFNYNLYLPIFKFSKNSLAMPDEFFIGTFIYLIKILVFR
jgi:hypothetical protein